MAKSRANLLARQGKFEDAAASLGPEIVSFQAQKTQADELRSKSEKFEQEGERKGELTKKAAANIDTINRVKKLDNLCKIIDALCSELLTLKKRCEDEPARLLALKATTNEQHDKLSADDVTKKLAMELEKQEHDLEKLVGTEMLVFCRAIKNLNSYLDGLETPKVTPILEIAKDDSTSLSSVGEALRKVIAQLEFLQLQGKESLKTLTIAALKTKERLTNQITFQEYENFGKTMQGSASPGLKILGGLMIILGAAIAVVGAPFIASALATVLGGAALIATTVGISLGIAAMAAIPGTLFFKNNKLQKEGMSKDMHDLNTALLN